jgi:hypothetical protein
MLTSVANQTNPMWIFSRQEQLLNLVYRSASSRIPVPGQTTHCIHSPITDSDHKDQQSTEAHKYRTPSKQSYVDLFTAGATPDSNLPERTDSPSRPDRPSYPPADQIGFQAEPWGTSTLFGGTDPLPQAAQHDPGNNVLIGHAGRRVTMI